VVCFDAAEASVSAMGDGNVDVMIVQNPYQMGYEGVILLHALVKNDQSVIKTMYPNYSQTGDEDIHSTELRVVVPDGAAEQTSPITKGMFDSNTQFFRHSEFLKWLGERGLKSS